TLNKGGTHNLTVRTRSDVALYVLNHKRAHLRALEERFRITITVSADPSVSPQVSYMVERGEQMHSTEQAKAIPAAAPPMTITVEGDDFVVPEEPEYEDEAITAAADEDEGEGAEEEGEALVSEDEESERDGGRRRRRRRGRSRGRGRQRDEVQPQPQN